MNSKYNNGRRKFIKESLSIFGGIVIIPRHVLGRGFVSTSDKINLGFIGLAVLFGVTSLSLLKVAFSL